MRLRWPRRAADSRGRREDRLLARRAQAHLPSVAPALALEALAVGSLHREERTVTWTGTLGDVRGVHVVLVVPPGLHAQLEASPSSADVLTRAVAAAVSETAGEVLADLALEPGDPGRGPIGGPYRSA